MKLEFNRCSHCDYGGCCEGVTISNKERRYIEKLIGKRISLNLGTPCMLFKKGKGCILKFEDRPIDCQIFPVEILWSNVKEKKFDFNVRGYCDVVYNNDYSIKKLLSAARSLCIKYANW